MKIYYSRSNHVGDEPLKHIRTFRKSLFEGVGLNNVITYKYNKGEHYTTAKLLKSDIVIVGTNSFEGADDIVRGCASEIKFAQDNNIPVFGIVQDIEEEFYFLHEIKANSGDVVIKDGEAYDTEYANLDLYAEMRALQNRADGSRRFCRIDDVESVAKMYRKLNLKTSTSPVDELEIF